MITLEDCIAFCGLTEEEVLAIAEHEHIPEAAACALAEYLLNQEHGPEKIRNMIVDDVRAAQARGDRAHVRTLLRGLKVAVVRHPMPYGDPERQAVQRFASLADLDAAACTIEEREEYEPHIRAGGIVLSGVDTARVLALAEQDADIIVWDGGNNDFPFVAPDPLRPGHETTHHPGEAVLCMADIVVVAKTNSASEADIRRVTGTARALVPAAPVVRAASVVTLADPAAVAGKRVLVVDDGPTLTHGGMAYGAGYVAAIEAGAGEIVDPRLSAAGGLAALFQRYAHLGKVLPAMGYSAAERADLEATIDGSSAEVVVAGTPIDLARVLALDKPVVRARYEFAEVGEPPVSRLIEDFLHRRGMLGPARPR
jgi:predicted GTPase